MECKDAVKKPHKYGEIEEGFIGKFWQEFDKAGIKIEWSKWYVPTCHLMLGSKFCRSVIY